MNALRHAAVVALLLSCGRTVIYQPGGCELDVEPARVDFGEVEPRAVATRTVVLTNVGNAVCRLTDIATTTDFSVQPSAAQLAPRKSVTLDVSFSGEGMPFDREGTLSFHGPKTEHVPLHAHLLHCALELTPATLSFDEQTLTQTAVLKNVGDGTCHITGLATDGDTSFAVTDASFDLGRDMSRTLEVRFTASTMPPTERKGRLLVHGDDEPTTALDALLHICVLTVAPNPFDLGNVLLNTVVTHPVTFSNTGTGTCVVSNISMLADPLFSLPTPPGTLTLAPQGSAPVPIRFSGFDSAPPHLRTGTLHFTSNDPTQPTGAVPLSAFINTLCTEAGQFIYTVDRSGTFSRFDPATLTSTAIGQLDCPEMTLPFSMNLDQAATAWVIYDDGHLFTVDVTTAHCSPTSFAPGQNGFFGFGMGSVFDAQSGTDTLFIAGGPNDITLGTLDLNALTTSVVGDIDAPRAEISGTGDGQLWVFTPSFASPTAAPFMLRLDRTTGATLERHDLTAITSNGGYAIKFWGGAFYIFIGTDVWRVNRDTLVPTQNAPTMPPTLVFTQGGLDVVGAGVSTCAPVMGQ